MFYGSSFKIVWIEMEFRRMEIRGGIFGYENWKKTVASQLARTGSGFDSYEENTSVYGFRTQRSFQETSNRIGK